MYILGKTQNIKTLNKLKGYIMTLEEKIEVVKAFSEGKPVEGCNKEVGLWEDKVYDIWDFDDCKYRIKPETTTTTKFKVGDVIVFMGDVNTTDFNTYEIIEVKQGYYWFNDISPRPIEEIEKEFINVRDALWYFEIYDYITKK